MVRRGSTVRVRQRAFRKGLQIRRCACQGSKRVSRAGTRGSSGGSHVVRTRGRLSAQESRVSHRLTPSLTRRASVALVKSAAPRSTITGRLGPRDAKCWLIEPEPATLENSLAEWGERNADHTIDDAAVEIGSSVQLLGMPRAMLLVAIFAVNLTLSHPLVESILFSLALAIGLTPQLLPAIAPRHASHSLPGRSARTGHGWSASPRATIARQRSRVSTSPRTGLVE